MTEIHTGQQVPGSLGPWVTGVTGSLGAWSGGGGHDQAYQYVCTVGGEKRGGVQITGEEKRLT